MTTNRIARKRRELMTLEERAGRVAHSTGDLHEAARAFGRVMTSETASDYARSSQAVALAKSAVKFTKAIERARRES
jgi:uncharacterized protein YoxC